MTSIDVTSTLTSTDVTSSRHLKDNNPVNTRRVGEGKLIALIDPVKFFDNCLVKSFYTEISLSFGYTCKQNRVKS